MIKKYYQKCGLKLKIFLVHIRKYILILVLKEMLFSMRHERFTRVVEGIMISVAAGIIVELIFR